MSRREEREQAFALLFERLVNQNSVEEVIENAGLARDCDVTDYIRTIAYGVEQTEEELNQIIEENLSASWKRSRLSKVTMALLQLAIYGGEDDASFLNGVLGSVAKKMEQSND